MEEEEGGMLFQGEGREEVLGIEKRRRHFSKFIEAPTALEYLSNFLAIGVSGSREVIKMPRLSTYAWERMRSWWREGVREMKRS